MATHIHIYRTSVKDADFKVVKSYPNSVEIRTLEEKTGTRFGVSSRLSWYVFRNNKNLSGAMTSLEAAEKMADRLSTTKDSSPAVNLLNEILSNLLKTEELCKRSMVPQVQDIERTLASAQTKLKGIIAKIADR